MKQIPYIIGGLQALFAWSLVFLVVLSGCASTGLRVDQFPAPAPAHAEAPKTTRAMLNPLVVVFAGGVVLAGVCLLWPKRQDA